MSFKNYRAIGYAILAAALYGASSPVSKKLLTHLPPTLMASMLYLGAGLGMSVLFLLQSRESKGAGIEKKDFPYVLGMILLDIAAPILLMMGLYKTTASTVSLLNNFEIVVTTLIALILFKESVGKRMWIAIFLITASSMILSISDFSKIELSSSSIFVLLACVSWGLENNCTRMLSLKNPVQIVVVKGLGSGVGAFMVALYLGESIGHIGYMVLALILGFFAYGLSITLYIRAQRDLGASRTSAFYAAAPFMGVLLSWFFLREPITGTFLLALAVMIVGTYFAVSETHDHEHVHGDEIHEHSHCHDDGHHDHIHLTSVSGEHTHVHTHSSIKHTHSHFPDMHHTHAH